MTNEEIRNSLAELISTFMLVFVGAGAVVVSNGNFVQIAFAFGFIVVAIMATFGHISGAHANPAVTLGILITGKINLRNAGFYWGAQFVGALLAAGALRIVLPSGELDAATLTLGQALPAPNVTAGMIIVLEAILTFFLVSVMLQAAVHGKSSVLAPVLVGMTLTALILMGGPISGASLNPARTLGPAFLAEETQDITEVMFYFVGTFLGGTLAGFLHSDTFAPSDADDKKRR